MLTGALPLLGGFALGLAARRRLQRHFSVVFRTTTAGGIAVIAFLAGWSFAGTPATVAALGVLLGAQLTAVALGAWVFRAQADGPLLSFSLYGNPGFWSVPVTAALFGPRPAVVIAAYDMVTQPRIALALKLMRSRAPVEQRARTALADYAPMAAVVVGLLLGTISDAPEAVPEVVAAGATVLAVVGGLLLGLAWPSEGLPDATERRLVARVLALHLTVVPALLFCATAAGVEVPAGAWVLALGPLPVGSLSVARLYGYSTTLAAGGLAVSMATAVALLPLVAWLGAH